MFSFECDYLQGAHPKVLKALCDTNRITQPGYGADIWWKSACDKIKAAFSAPDPVRSAFLLPEGAGRIPAHTGEVSEKPFRTALFFNPAVYAALGEEELSYFDICFLPLFRYGLLPA